MKIEQQKKCPCLSSKFSEKLNVYICDDCGQMCKKETEEIDYNMPNNHEQLKKLGCWNRLMESEQDDLRFFMKSALLAQLEELEGEIENMKKYHKEFECNGANNGKGCYETFCEDQNCINASREHNQALSSILSLLQDKKKEYE